MYRLLLQLRKVEESRVLKSLCSWEFLKGNVTWLYTSCFVVTISLSLSLRHRGAGEELVSAEEAGL